MNINEISSREKTRNETEVQKLVDSKISFISKPIEVQACKINLDDTEENLKELGLIKENGNWYVKNRKYFPNPVNKNSILIKYNENDIGHCSTKDFLAKYVNYEEFKQKNIKDIRKEDLESNKFAKQYTKYNNIYISLAESGTTLKSKEGNFSTQYGVIAVENHEDNYRFYEMETETFLEKYMPDPMNPISTLAYSIIKELQENNLDESKATFEIYLNKFRHIDRDIRSYQEYFSEYENTLDLREKYKHANMLVRELQTMYEGKMKNLTYKEKLRMAENLLIGLNEKSDINDFERQLRIKYILLYLLPKTNNHQHLKGSVPKDTVIELAKEKGLNIDKIEKAYKKAANGFESLDEFSNTYATIARSIRHMEDYKVAINSIVEEAIKNEQLTVEIRCSILGLKDKEGNEITGWDAGEYIVNAIEEIKVKKENCPKIGFTILGYRGRDWKPEEVDEHSRLTIELAKKYPDKKFSFDLAGPEDTGYPAIFFKDAFEAIYKYNETTTGEKIGITVHAGETPTYDEGKKGHYSVREGLQINSDRIGHAVRAVDDLETLNLLKADGATVEICGVCNVLSIPINTENHTHHPIDELIKREIPITICTDNDSICGTNIINEYALLLISGHKEVASWDTIIKIARHGIECSFITDNDKKEALETFEERVKNINHLLKTYTTIVEDTIEDIIIKIESIFNENQDEDEENGNSLYL
ncbi:hypothetical protein HOJ01_03680 [bacterium]|jgi:adenosine deaminase|nr:hypothetical protein [bacterium]MBT6293881.1 hypothetical protein [bacterium]